MRKVYSFSFDEFSNIMQHKQILRTISPIDLNWNVDLDDCVINDRVQVEVMNKQGITFALVALKSELSKYNVYFIAYVDKDLRLRGYMPQYGNLYNPWTGTFFGEESPFKRSQRSITQMPKIYYEEDKENGGYKETEKYKKDFEEANLKENKEEMIKEFLYFHSL